MKKNILIAAVAALTLAFAACQKEDIVTPGNNVNPGTENPNGPMVKSTEDLHGTEWSYTVTYTELINSLLGTDIPCMEEIEDETYVFGLNFDGEFAHFSFPENIVAVAGEEGMMEQISSVSYTYSYDGTTHTGYLDGVAENEEGEEVPAQLQFTYDDATDVITFNLDMFYAEDGTPVTLTLNFARN